MMSRRPTSSLLAWSVIGLLGGHQAAYALAYRDPSVLAHMLEETGHNWMWLAPLLLAGAGLSALVLGARGSQPVATFRWRFAALAVIQTALFLFLEVGERLGGGDAAHLVAHLLDNGGWLVLALGLILQLVTAFLVAAASGVVARIAWALRRRGARRARMPWTATPAAVARHALRGLLLARACGPRAPPARA